MRTRDRQIQTETRAISTLWNKSVYIYQEFITGHSRGALGEPKSNVGSPNAKRERCTTMFKEDIIKRISSTTGEPKRKVAMFINMFLACVQLGLVKEKKVELRGFGSFHVRVRKARRVANPRTGEIMMIPPGKVVRFR